MWNVYGRSGLREASPLVPSTFKVAGCWKLFRNLSTAHELNGLKQGGASPIRRIFGTFLANLSNVLRAKFAESTFHALELIEDKTTVLLPNHKRARVEVPRPIGRRSGGSAL
jgi:hypothetical protein